MNDAFDVFYRDTCRRLIRYAFGLTGDPNEAQDMVQEAYTRAWQRWRLLRSYDDAEAWLRLIVTLLAGEQIILGRIRIRPVSCSRDARSLLCATGTGFQVWRFAAD